MRGVSKSQLTPTKSAQMAGIIHSVTGGMIGVTKPSKSLNVIGMGKQSTAEPYGRGQMNCDGCCNQRGGQSANKGDPGQLLRLCPSAARHGKAPAATDAHRKREDCRAYWNNSVTP